MSSAAEFRGHLWSSAGVLGAASRWPGPDQSLDALVAETVQAALLSANIKLDDVDTVVALGNEQVDGGISPLLMAEAAGGLGRSYLFVTGASGDALHSALAFLGAGMAQTVLLVGWSQSTKPGVDDLSTLSTDPLFHQPLGLGLVELAAMHFARLEFDGLVDAREVRGYAEEMKRRRGRDRSLNGARIVRWSGRGSIPFNDGRKKPVGPDRIDRATALVLAAEQRSATVRITDVAKADRSLVPDEIDPRVWLDDVLRQIEPNVSTVTDCAIIEVSAPSAYCEWRALGALGLGGTWSAREGFNRFGGGLAAYNGTADGLARLESAFRGLLEPLGVARSGLVIEMSGPLGQSVTAVRLAAGPPP